MNEHAQWIRSALKTTPSPLGEKVALILGQTFSGIYHLDHKSLKEAKWDDDLFIEVRLRNRDCLATFDFDYLTTLVILAHDQCVRLEISASYRGVLWLIFHPRSGREGRMYQRHPTIEEAIANARRKNL